MRACLVLLLASIAACKPGEIDELPERGTTDSESGGTTAAGESGTDSPDDDTSTDGEDSSDTGDPCEFEAPGAELLRCPIESGSNLAYDGTWLYYTTTTITNYDYATAVHRTRDDGSEHELLAMGLDCARHLTVVDGHVYWNCVDDGYIQRVPSVGGAVEDVATDLVQPNSYVVHEGAIYVAQNVATADIVRVDIGGGGIEVLYAGVEYPDRLHRHEQDLYWVTNTDDIWMDNPIMRGTLDGTPAEAVVPDGDNVDTDDTHLHWTTQVGDDFMVRRMPLGGGALQEMALLSQASTNVLTDDYLYVTFGSTEPGIDATGEIHRVVSSGGPLELVLDEQNGVSGALASDAHLYWRTRNGLARLALP